MWGVRGLGMEIALEAGGPQYRWAGVTGGHGRVVGGSCGGPQFTRVGRWAGWSRALCWALPGLAVLCAVTVESGGGGKFAL